MKITKNALSSRDNRRAINVLERVDKNKDISSAPKDVIKHVRMLLIQNGLGLEDIIKIYRDIANMKLKGTRVSDVVKVLENVQKIHLSELDNLDNNLRALDSKNAQEIAEYTRVTLDKTQIILERLQARRVNQNVPERS